MMMEKASRSEKNGWIAVHLEGTPEVIGYQHGYLLAEEIIDLRGAMTVLNEKTTGRNWKFFRDESERIFWPNIPDEYRNELNGIVSGVNAKLGAGKIDRKDILAMNSILEMSWYYVPWLNSKNNPVPPDPTPPGHCSAIAATGTWTKDGKIVMAHNNWVEYVIGERWNVILDIVPEKGNRIVMDALPGFIHSGDDFYINSAGIIVTETTITQFKGFDTTGVAEFVRARKARWEEILNSNKGKIDVNAAMKFIGDHYDTWRKKDEAGALTLCGHIDTDKLGAPDMGWPAFTAAGAVQGKATDGNLATEMKLWAIMGHPCGEPFIASRFLSDHPEFGYQKEYLRNMPGHEWTLFGKL